MRRLLSWSLMVPCLLLARASQAQDVIYKDDFESCSRADVDQDRLSGCEEFQLGTDALSADTDGDGLRDGDEVLGTVRGLDLPAMGVSPTRKDLLVEFDWTDEASACPQHSHRPTAEVIEKVRAFYAAAPVSNPDGSTGINLVADVGQGGVFTGGNFIAIPDGVTSSLGQPYRDWKAANFAPNRQGYFRYQLHGHRTSLDPAVDQGGLAALNGDDSIVAMHCDTRARSTFIVVVHELGHNLGLHHGGADGFHGKPNYNSVMNARFIDGLDVDCDTFGDLAADHVGYSDGSRNTLVPDAMDEALGVCKPDHPQRKPIDWNCNGVVDSGTVVDSVLRGMGTVVPDHDDYAALKIPPFALQVKGEAKVEGRGVVGDPVSGPCFPLMPKQSSRVSGAICPYPTPFR